LPAWLIAVQPLPKLEADELQLLEKVVGVDLSPLAQYFATAGTHVQNFLVILND
jgi:hypothetical protein